METLDVPADLNAEEQAIYQNLLLQASQHSQQAQNQPTVKCIPRPGFCIKTKDKKNDKVFLNGCMHENVPLPKDVSEKELLEILESEDPSRFRLPMSLGEPHAEIDKSGRGCTAYDILIHPDFMAKVQNSDVFMGFFITCAIEGLENKYSIELDRNWVMLKNRRCVGKLQEQNLRKQSKPWIVDMEPGPISGGKSLISEVSDSQADEKSNAPQPKITIVQEPTSGHPEFLVAEIELPKVKSAKTLTLDLGEDRILLKTRSNVYYLDIYLPFNIIQEDCGSQFNKANKILTITMPVQQS